MKKRLIKLLHDLKNKIRHDDKLLTDDIEQLRNLLLEIKYYLTEISYVKLREEEIFELTLLIEKLEPIAIIEDNNYPLLAKEISFLYDRISLRNENLRPPAYFICLPD